MVAINVQLPADVETKLRDEALRRNLSIEDAAARLLIEHLRLPPTGELDTDEDEILIIQRAVDEVRSGK
jgi:hypothetical protein